MTRNPILVIDGGCIGGFTAEGALTQKGFLVDGARPGAELKARLAQPI